MPRWVKANGCVFDADQVVALCPLGPAPGDEGGDAGEPREKVVLRAGFELELRGGPAQRFREMFLEHLGAGVQDHDLGAVQVNETRVMVAEVEPASRPVGSPS
jgi:hypothetical protein